MNRKIILSYVIVFLAIWTVNAQKKSEAKVQQSSSANPGTDLFEHYMKVYDQASIKYNDFAVARNALYSMIALRPDRLGLKDTLAYLYFNSNNYLQVILLGNEILETNPARSEILELVAVSEQNLGLQKNALESFEKLYALTKDVYHKYNIASLQYMLKRYGECSESLNSILSSTDSLGDVTISNNQGESQKVPLKAAAFNMRGVIALEINQIDVARQNFQKALELFPEFTLAKGNLEMANGKENEAPPQKKDK